MDDVRLEAHEARALVLDILEAIEVLERLGPNLQEVENLYWWAQFILDRGLP